MATKVGYIRQDPTEAINWAEVGANFSGILKEEARVREEKKAEIDRATREMERVLKDSPMGDSKNMNEWSLKYASDAQSQLLMTNALLKNGQLKPKDYTIIRQNLADGTDQAFTLVQEYQDEYSDKMARMKAKYGDVGPDGKPIIPSQELEQFLMGTAEGFGNFNASELVINPTSGNVMVGFRNEKGEIESDPNKLVGINNLRNRIKSKFDLYDMQGAITKAKAETFGQFQQIDAKLGTLYQKGLLATISGPAFRSPSNIADMVSKGYITAEEGKLIGMQAKTEDLWAESQLSNTYNVTSLLTNNLGGVAPNGQPYKFTFNANEEDDNTILLQQVDGAVVPNFESAIGKAHKQTAKDGLLAATRGALDVTVAGQVVGGNTPPQKQEWQAKGDAAKKAADSTVGAWGMLYNGTAEEVEAAVNTLMGTAKSKEQGVQSIDTKSKPGYVIITYDGSGTIGKSTREIPMIRVDTNPDGTTKTSPIPFDEFAASGNEIHGVDDVTDAIKAAGSDATRPYNNGIGAYGERTKAPKSRSPIEKLDDYTRSNQPADDLFGSSDGSGFEKHINDKYSSLGFTAKEGTVLDVVTVTAPNGKTKDIRYDGDASTARAELISFVKANTPKTTDADLLVLSSLSSGGDASQF